MPPRSSAELLCAACAAAVMGAGVIAIGSPACGPACDTTDAANPPQRFEGGTVTGTETLYYTTSDWRTGLLPFPGGKRYELVHHLGFAPTHVSVYVSFAEQNEPLTPCSGNTCVLQAVRDDAIIVKNDTCSEFWIRVVASGPSPNSGDAGVGSDSAATD